MNKERIKSFVLFLLVTISFVLTTRIWFNFSIEGLFVMPTKNNTFEVDLAYEKGNLLKPSKVVIHTGLNHALLSNNTRDKEYYSSILNGSKDILRDWLNNYNKYASSTLPISKFEEARRGRAVELIFEYPMDITNIKSLLDIEKNPWSEIKAVDSIIINPQEGKIFIVDASKETIYKYASLQMPTSMESVIEKIEKKNDFVCVFLNEFNKEDYKPYGDYAIAPVSVVTMPVLKVKPEIETSTKLNNEIMRFFNDESSNISSMPDIDGSVTFTDKEEEAVTIDMQGTLEYYKYNVTSDNAKNTGIKEAIDIATQYIVQHGDFTHDFYLSGVNSIMQGGRTSYIISFDYKYNGVPIITELDTNSSAIEIEIVGQEVKRYKRNVRVIEDQSKTINIKSFNDILNIVWGDLDRKLNAQKSEFIIDLKDLHLEYLERNGALIPVWIVNVTVEDNQNNQHDKKYIIDAEVGELTTILGER